MMCILLLLLIYQDVQFLLVNVGHGQGHKFLMVEIMNKILRKCDLNYQ